MFDTKQLTIQKKNACLESKNHLLESDIAVLKGRIRDLENRQTKILASTNNKVNEMCVKFNSVKVLLPINEWLFHSENKEGVPNIILAFKNQSIWSVGWPVRQEISSINDFLFSVFRN